MWRRLSKFWNERTWKSIIFSLDENFIHLFIISSTLFELNWKSAHVYMRNAIREVSWPTKLISFHIQVEFLCIQTCNVVVVYYMIIFWLVSNNWFIFFIIHIRYIYDDYVKFSFYWMCLSVAKSRTSRPNSKEESKIFLQRARHDTNENAEFILNFLKLKLMFVKLAHHPNNSFFASSPTRHSAENSRQHEQKLHKKRRGQRRRGMTRLETPHSTRLSK